MREIVGRARAGVKVLLGAGVGERVQEVPEHLTRRRSGAKPCLVGVAREHLEVPRRERDPDEAGVRNARRAARPAPRAWSRRARGVDERAKTQSSTGL